MYLKNLSIGLYMLVACCRRPRPRRCCYCYYYGSLMVEMEATVVTCAFVVSILSNRMFLFLAEDLAGSKGIEELLPNKS